MRTLRTAPTAAVRTSAASATAKLSQVKNGDSGFKVKTTASSITVSGTAKGPTTINPSTGRHEADEYLNTEEVRPELSVAFDQDKMPKFDTTNGYTEKNKWYFAHVAATPTRTGAKPADALKALAAKIDANSAYKAKIVSNADGSATLTVTRK